MSEPVLVVGLTGGIASGKSTIADMFTDFDTSIPDLTLRVSLYDPEYFM